MKELTIDGIDAYVHDHTRPEPELLQSLAGKTRAEMDYPQMLTGRVEGRFLKMMCQLVNPKLVVEVGTFTGYSALSMAEGLSDDGRIITCEINPKAQQVAQQAFDSSPVGQRIEIRMGPALETIRAIDETVDLSFIDAHKPEYAQYYEELLQRTRPGGVLLLDNMLWSGDVLDPKDADAQALADLNQTIVADDRVENVLLSVRDGLQLVRKK